MKDPERIFADIFASAVSYWSRDNLRIDPFLLDKTRDNRFGLSLIVRPAGELREKFAGIQTELRGILGNQYDYPGSDFHLTVLTLVSCVDGFRSAPQEEEKYIRCLSPVLSLERPFRLTFRGVCASADSVFFKLADGYSRLNALREGLRRVISGQGLDSAMDKRYRLEAGHVTGTRFIRRSDRIPALLEFLKANAGREMGSMEVGSIELVNNDWFMSASKSRILKSFPLGVPEGGNGAAPFPS